MTWSLQPATTEDRQTLVDLYLALLMHLAEFDAAVTATDAAAQWWVDHVFLPAAGRGEPVLIAREPAGPAIGGIFWPVGPQPGPKIAFGYGTYVVPGWRRKGVGAALREAALLRLKGIGASLLVGCAHLNNEPGRQSLLSFGMMPAATLYYLKL